MRCPIIFKDHLSNFKVTWDEKLQILTPIWRFRTVTPVYIDQCLWNDAKALCSIEEVLYCFSRSSVKFQGHTALKIFEFDRNWAFPDCSSSLNSPVAMKCCTKLETAKKRCPFVFQGHPSNFKATRYKTSPILTQIGRFRTIGRSQLSNPSDLPCWWSSVKFQGHTAKKKCRFWPKLGVTQSLNSPMAMKVIRQISRSQG